MSTLKYRAMDDCARISHSIGVYVDGELVGGLDICAELDRKGQLAATLKVPQPAA